MAGDWRKLCLSPHEPRLVTRSWLGSQYLSASLGGRWLALLERLGELELNPSIATDPA
jgi:hypothetical protein